jgi:hypothetical protein
MLELDLDEEDVVQFAQLLGLAIFYSRKSYNPQVLISDMISAWGVQKLAWVEKLGDYIFKIEFTTEEEKLRIVEGGPWCHKGDAFIVVHYDGLMRPSEIRIQTIGLWVRQYDLPPAMMKQTFAQQMGGQLGKMLKSDTRYPGYMRIRVEWPLVNPLKPELVVKIKGRG